MSKHRLCVGQDVIVEWLDSACGDSGKPASGAIQLEFGRTHGRVTKLDRDDRIHAKLCRGRCRCDYVELAMCSSGPDDPRSDLAMIWVEAIVRVIHVGAE